MKKYMYFVLGYITAIATILVVSCSYTPLEAGGSELGSTSWNPVYVKIVE
tara:strand:- start:63 stop:212 length:150 start_codon:yes stop_codon:yes gene_type:complete